jgi:DNA-binding MarR family transcriptional regulator
MVTPSLEGKVQDDIVLRVLDAVDRDPAVTQRTLARELDIALGLTNAYLKRCIRKGLIKVGQVPARRYAYFLTPRGFAEKSRLTASYLSFSLSFFRRARDECNELCVSAVGRGQHSLALIGEGDLADIASLVARTHPLTIVSVVRWTGDVGKFRKELSELQAIDGAIITAMVRPQEAFQAACDSLGVDRVYAPQVLRLRSAKLGSRSAEGAK